MSTNFYARTSGLSGKLRTRLAALAAGLLLAPAAWAQIDVPAGNPNDASGRRPLGTWFGYERSAMIYTAAEIGTSGNLTEVGFYLNAVSTPGAAPTKIYLKTVSNATFAAATTVAAEQAGATLVYDSTIPVASFTPNSWVTLPLTTPFAYNGTSNLEVIVETNATGAGNETSGGKVFRYSSTGTGTNRAQFWSADTNPPATTGTLSITRPNIRLVGLTPLTCPPVSGVAVGSITTTSAQVSFTAPATSTSYTVTYTPAGGTPTTVTPAPTASPVSLTGLTPNTAYTVTIVGNCSGSTTSPVVTASFRTLAIAPANDDCATAVTLTPGAPGAACAPTSGTVTGATQSIAPIACNGFTASTAQDVWYSFTATSTAHIITVAGNFDGVLEVLSGACGSTTNVACSDASTGTGETLSLTGLTVGTTYRARYYPYAANPTNGAFTICITTLPANDAAVQAVFALGKTLVAVPQVVQAVVSNLGSSALTNVPVTLNVTGATTFTDAKVVASLAPGASTTVTFAPYTPAAVGNNAIAVTVPADGLNTNNSRSYPQVVTANSLSYLDDSQPVTASVGVSSTTPGGTLAVKYVINAAAPLTDVKLSFLPSPTTTSTYQVVVLSATPAGLPNAVIFTSPTLSRPTTAGVVTVPITATTVNGTFFVGLKEVTGNVGIGYQVEDPLRPGTFYFQGTPTAAWAEVNTTPLKTRLGIEVTLNRTLATNSPALSRSISMFPNPSNGQVTLDIRDAKAKGAMQVQVTNMLGQIVHTAAVRDNAENKLNLSGLADGMYVLRVSSGTEYTIRQLVLTK